MFNIVNTFDTILLPVVAKSPVRKFTRDRTNSPVGCMQRPRFASNRVMCGCLQCQQTGHDHSPRSCHVPRPSLCAAMLKDAHWQPARFLKSSVFEVPKGPHPYVGSYNVVVGLQVRITGPNEVGLCALDSILLEGQVASPSVVWFTHVMSLLLLRL